MELKRAARDITGKRRDLPGHKSVRIGIQAAAGYAFAMGILEKYRQAEGYDLPSASFVYLDPQGLEEEQEAVRELAAQISVLNRIRISYFNQSYERKYYWNVRMHCEQLLLRLSGSTALSREARELRELYTELVREQEGVFLQPHGGPEAQGHPGSRDQKNPGEGSGVRQSRKKEIEQRLQEILCRAGKRAEKKTAAGVMRQDFISSLPSRQVPSAWKSQQAKQFFWNVQRSPRWEQELLFRASGVRSLPAFERYLAWIREENWDRELEKIKDRTQALLQDREILEAVLLERFLQNGSSDAISSPDKRTAGTEEALPWKGLRDSFGKEPGSFRFGEQPGNGLETYLKTLEYLNIISNTENEKNISRDKENILEMIQENRWLQAFVSGGRITSGKSGSGGSGPLSGLKTEFAAMSGEQWMEWKKRLSLQILETILEPAGRKETLEKSEEGAGLSDTGKGSLQPPDARTGPFFMDMEPIRQPEEELWNERMDRAERALDRAELWNVRRDYLDAAAEAVSYLGLEEWTRFKKELTAVDWMEADASDGWQKEGPVLSWIRSRNGAEGTGSPEEMSEEKGSMIRALYDQARPEWIFGASYGMLKERLEKSTILASYLQKEEDEERKEPVWPEEVKQPETRKQLEAGLAGVDRNTQEADRGGVARRIQRLSGGAWRIFLEEFLTDGNTDLVTQVSQSLIMGQASGQEEEIPLAEEKQRVLEYLEQKSDQIPAAPVSIGDGGQRKHPVVQMEERVLDLLKNGTAGRDLTEYKESIQKAVGKSAPWHSKREQAEQALDRAELWSVRREFLDTAAEAVSYLGLEEWTQFKKELAAADGAEADASDVRQEEGPVLSWIRSRSGAEEAGSPEEMSEEKGAMIRALYDQAQPEWIFGASYRTLKERLEKSKILASYLQTEAEEERKAAVWSEEWEQTEAELAGTDRNTQEADRGRVARRIQRLSGGAWRIFLEGFLNDGNIDLVPELPKSLMMGQAPGQEEEIPLAEEKRRVLEYLEQRADQPEQIPDHTPVRVLDGRPGAERGAEPGGDTRETGADHRDDAAFLGTRVQKERSIVQMAEQVLGLLKNGELSVWDRSEDPGSGHGAAWREWAAHVLDQVETRRAHEGFLAAAAEAVASLGLEEWSLLKKELAAWPDDLGTGGTDPEGQYTEGPVLSWIREHGSKEAAGAPEHMSGEKSGLVQALWEQKQTRWIDGSDYSVLKTILEKSRVLSAYLQSGEDVAGDRKSSEAVPGTEAGRTSEEVWNGTVRRIQKLSASEWSLFLEKFLEERDDAIVPGLPRALIGRDTSGQPEEKIPLAEEKRRVLEFLDWRAAPVSDHIRNAETDAGSSSTVRSRRVWLDQEVQLRNVFQEVRKAAMALFSLPSRNRALWGHPSYLKTSASSLWQPEIQEERGEKEPFYNARAAAIHTLERLRQERIAVKREEESASVSVEGLPVAEIQRERTTYGTSRTARPDMDGNSPEAGVLGPEKGRSEGPGEQTPPAYGPVDMVVNQGAGAGRQPGGAQAEPQMSIKQEIQRQVKDEITDIQFITRSQTVTQEGSVQDRIQLENLLKRMESQEKELEKIKKDREAGSEGLAEARVSRNVMKKLQDQMQMERLRRGL